jgi:tetratricopeptide (TPR) repeat protein
MKEHNALGIENEQYDLSEKQLLSLGSHLERDGMTEQALSVLELSCREFPESAPAFETLADLFLKAGKVDQALQNYEKSLELNPGNEDLKKKLSDLKKESR